MTETGQDQETFAFNFKLTKMVHQEDFIMFCDFESYKFYRINDLVVCKISVCIFEDLSPQKI